MGFNRWINDNTFDIPPRLNMNPAARFWTVRREG